MCTWLAVAGHLAEHQPGWSQGGFGREQVLPSPAMVNGFTPAFLGYLDQLFLVGSGFCMFLGWKGPGKVTVASTPCYGFDPIPPAR